MSEYDDLKPQKGMMGVAIKWILFLAVLFAVIWFVALPFFGASKLVGRESKKFDSETTAQVYDSSRQYQQGTNRDLARYCREWREADDSAKPAVRELFASTLDTYEGGLSDRNAECKEEMGL